jgi:hypothetical protein
MHESTVLYCQFCKLCLTNRFCPPKLNISSFSRLKVLYLLLLVSPWTKQHIREAFISLNQTFPRPCHKKVRISTFNYFWSKSLKTLRSHANDAFQICNLVYGPTHTANTQSNLMRRWSPPIAHRLAMFCQNGIPQ